MLHLLEWNFHNSCLIYLIDTSKYEKKFLLKVRKFPNTKMADVNMGKILTSLWQIVKVLSIKCYPK